MPEPRRVRRRRSAAAPPAPPAPIGLPDPRGRGAAGQRLAQPRQPPGHCLPLSHSSSILSVGCSPTVQPPFHCGHYSLLQIWETWEIHQKVRGSFTLWGSVCWSVRGSLSGTGAKGSSELESLPGETERERWLFLVAATPACFAVGSDPREAARTLCLNSPACPPKP